MKTISLILFTFICFFSIGAQTKTTNVLPANLAKFEDSQEILNNSIIKSRLKKLLGAKGYAAFTESWETVNPIIKKGNFLFSSGCLIHACGHAESAIVIDLANQTVHAAIYRDEEKIKYFNEKSRRTPRAIKNWANRLSAKR